MRAVAVAGAVFVGGPVAGRLEQLPWVDADADAAEVAEPGFGELASVLADTNAAHWNASTVSGGGSSRRMRWSTQSSEPHGTT